MKTKRKVLSARVRCLPGIASRYIWHLEELVQREGPQKVVLFCRVSTNRQKENLPAQESDLRRQAKALGCKVVDLFSSFETGAVEEARVTILRAIERAKERKAILVAVSRDRLLRDPAYQIKRTFKMDSPTDFRYREFRDLLNGVRAATIIDPDASSGVVRSQQTKIGQEARGRKGGRPRKMPEGWKKERRDQLKPKAKELREEGRSYRDIGRQLGVPFSTVRTWVD